MTGLIPDWPFALTGLGSMTEGRTGWVHDGLYDREEGTGVQEEELVLVVPGVACTISGSRWEVRRNNRGGGCFCGASRTTNGQAGKKTGGRPVAEEAVVDTNDTSMSVHVLYRLVVHSTS